MTDLPDDFRDMLVELAIAGADFVIVGGFAVAFHGHPRTTKDLDIFVRPTPEPRTACTRRSRASERLYKLST
jgi:hypothetical protein